MMVMPKDTPHLTVYESWQLNLEKNEVATAVCKFPEHLIPLIVHFAGLDTPFGCLSAPKTFKKGIETRESCGNCLIK